MTEKQCIFGLAVTLWVALAFVIWHRDEIMWVIGS